MEQIAGLFFMFAKRGHFCAFIKINNFSDVVVFFNIDSSGIKTLMKNHIQDCRFFNDELLLLDIW